VGRARDAAGHASSVTGGDQRCPKEDYEYVVKCDCYRVFPDVAENEV
jgi:hypothetical protein